MALSTTKAQQRWKVRNQDKVNESMRNYKKLHPERHRAHSAVAYALKTGKLVRPDECEDCGRYDEWNGQSLGTIESHHVDYSRPLDVEWFCKECHNEERNETYGWNTI